MNQKLKCSSLKCLTCHLRTSGDRCRRGFGVCTAQENEMCMTLKLYKDGELNIIYMECEKFCKNLQFKQDGWTYVHNCCATDYCNNEI
ncbi:prostate and testis expressed protein 3 [Echinops telfairi]|uniref:Prostate and testis expressed protein 3 n=1 Tax=Echinops telfairi TaxID=9371 RepID=A0ABM1VMY7_ECHTE|nr:prostate and testis expressed protein 3 [Echinops telfairi]